MLPRGKPRLIPLFCMELPMDLVPMDMLDLVLMVIPLLSMVDTSEAMLLPTPTLLVLIILLTLLLLVVMPLKDVMSPTLPVLSMLPREKLRLILLFCMELPMDLVPMDIMDLVPMDMLDLVPMDMLDLEPMDMLMLPDMPM